MGGVSSNEAGTRFQALVLPYLADAYALARCVTQAQCWNRRDSRADIVAACRYVRFVPLGNIALLQTFSARTNRFGDTLKILHTAYAADDASEKNDASTIR